MEKHTEYDHQPEVWFADLTLKHFFGILAITAVFNTVIAGFVYTIELFQKAFLPCFIMSQTIGFAICLLLVGSFVIFKPKSNLIFYSTRCPM